MKIKHLPAGIQRVQASRPSPFAIFGVVFALFGTMPLLVLLGIVPLDPESASLDEAAPMLWLMSGLFITVGLSLALLRRGFDFDPRTRHIEIWRKIGFVFSRRRVALDDIDCVAFMLEARQHTSNRSSRPQYAVNLRTHTGEQTIARAPKIQGARSVAEQMARMLEVDVVDATREDAPRRRFDELDLSLREQRKRAAQAAEQPAALAEAPKRMRSSVRPVDDGLHITIPATGVTPLHVLGFLFGCGPIVMMMVFYLITRSQGGDTPGWAIGAMAAMALAPSLTIWGTVLYHAMRSYELEVSRTGLHILQRGLLKKENRLAAEEIEELSLATKSEGTNLLGVRPPLVATSDEARAEFGQGLSFEEQSYLHSVLLTLLSAPQD